MAKKRKRDRGAALAMDVVAAAADIPASPPGLSTAEAMDTTDVIATGAELDLLSFKKKKKKNKSNGLQIQGIPKKGPQKRKAVKVRKEKSIERALLNMDKQQEKLQRSEVKSERVQSLKNLY